MKTTSQALTWFVLSSSASACPFGSRGGQLPNDAVHRQQGLRRRLTSINNHPASQRKLQEDCISSDTYDAIEADITALSAAQVDNIARGHFLGGILRLGESMMTA